MDPLQIRHRSIARPTPLDLQRIREQEAESTVHGGIHSSRPGRGTRDDSPPRGSCVGPGQLRATGRGRAGLPPSTRLTRPNRCPGGAGAVAPSRRGHVNLLFNAHQEVGWDRSLARYRADRSGRRAAPPSSRVVGVTLEAARRPRVRPTELQARDRRGPGSERSLAGNPHRSASGRASVPRHADSCVLSGSDAGKDRTKRPCSSQWQLLVPPMGASGAAAHVNV